MTVDAPYFSSCKLSVDGNSCEKSKCIANAHFAHEQQYTSARWRYADLLPIHRRGSRSCGIGVNAPVRRGLLTPFFIKPKLEVDILPRGIPPPEVSLGIEQEISFDLGIGGSPDIISQCLMLKAKNYGIPKLGAMMWLNGAGPYHMRWEMPETVPETYKSGNRDFIRGRYIESPRHIPVIKDEKLPLFVWYAYRRGQDEKLTLNTTPLLTQRLAEVKKPFIDVEIQFVPVDKKPRKYQLCVNSWDELSLTERA
jgi:hypothetical protein